MTAVGRRVRRMTVVLLILVTAVGLGTPASGQSVAPALLPTLALDPPDGPRGTSVTARAAGYSSCPPTGSDDASPGSVAFLWDGVEVATAGVVAADGTATAKFQVPDDASIGSHTVRSQCVGNGDLPHDESFEVIPPRVIPVVVPSVLGMTRAQATKTLIGADLEVGETTGEGSLVEDQDPDAGIEVDPGTQVDLEFSREEPVVVTVPDVVGMSAAEAEDAIVDAGLTPGQRDGKGDTVTRQSPAAGSEVPELTVVNLEMIAEPEVDVVVPDLEGRQVADAQATLVASKLKLGLVRGSGDVVRTQDPPAGVLVPAGSSVNISLKRGVKPEDLVTVPDLVGLTVPEARRACKAVGLLLGDTPSTEDAISSQQPVAGLLVPVGSTVAVAFPEPTDWTPIVLVVGLLVLLLVGSVAATVALRQHRERAWVRTHVEFAADAGPPALAEPVDADAPEGKARHVVQLTPRAEPESTVVTEEWRDDH